MRERGRRWAVETVSGALRESQNFVSGLVLNLALIIGVVVFRWGLVNEDAWDMGATPLQPIALIPPMYWRNIKFVGSKAIGSGVFIGAVMIPVVSSYDLDSGLPLSVGLAIAGIVLFQLRRIWRYFIADRSYRDKSPADAMEFAFAPVVELYLMFVYVVAPVTVVLAGITFAMDTDLNARLVLLFYLVPMGAIRAWIGSLDPQTADLEISFN
jgi:hypothetical protein